MRTNLKIIAGIVPTWLTCACNSRSARLPLLGEPSYQTVQTPHGPKTDTIYPVVPSFSVTDQQDRVVNNRTVRNKIYIANFFFTSCPAICPVMNRNLKKVYDLYAAKSGILFLSHSIDPNHDTPEILARYAQGLGADPEKWRFVTGKKEDIYQLAEKGYYSPANNDDGQQGGYVHSSGLILIDRNGHMRGVYDGTSDEEVNQLINDVPLLLAEK